MMLRLYDSPISGNAYKVRLLLALLGIEYDRVKLDFDSTGTRSEAFLAKNPNGKIPLLELDDGTYLAESNAIQFYLAEGTRYLPDDRLGRAQVLQWMFFEQYSHEPYVAVVRHWLHLGLAQERATEIQEKQERGHDALSLMNRHLATREWFVGNTLTIADIALYAYTHVADEGGFDLSRYPAVRTWLTRVGSVEGHVAIDA